MKSIYIYIQKNNQTK